MVRLRPGFSHNRLEGGAPHHYRNLPGAARGEVNHNLKEQHAGSVTMRGMVPCLPCARAAPLGRTTRTHARTERVCVGQRHAHHVPTNTLSPGGHAGGPLAR